MGIPIVAATDFDYGEEKTDLTIAREASEQAANGLPIPQIIQSITSRAAECLGIGGRVGAIRKDFEADLVVLGRNPLEDIGALKDVQIVINDGKVVLNRAAPPK